MAASFCIYNIEGRICHFGREVDPYTDHYNELRLYWTAAADWRCELWTDLETRIDLVNYSRLANTIADLIREPHMTPLTIGIHGDWGSGKSSVMKMVYEKLPETSFLRISFNGWAFEGFEDAKLALMETLVDELAKDQRVLERAKTTIVSLVKRLNVLKLLRKSTSLALAVHGVPIDVHSLIGTFKEVAESDSSTAIAEKDDDGWLRSAKTDTPSHIHGFRSELETLVEKAQAGRLVVFIDDLDRCLPETAIDTLEAIKLFMSVKDTTFVIAADEAFIQYAVSQHFPGMPAASGPGNVASNYLEKLIQIPFRLPRLNRIESRRYISLLLMENSLRATPAVFESILARIESAPTTPWEPLDVRALVANEEFRAHQASLNVQLDLATQISTALHDIAKGNPRQIKRFLNTFTLRRRIAQAYALADSIDDRVLAKLQLLERFSPESYSEVVSAATARPDGRVTFISELENRDLENDGLAALSDPAVPEPFVGEDSRKEWILAWLKAGVRVGDEDLRPYIFVSRENATDFATGTDIDAGLAALAVQLMEADPFAAGALAPRVEALTLDERMKLTEIVMARVMGAGRLDQRPNEVRNVNLLTAAAPDAQKIVLLHFDSLPVGNVRPWMPSFLSRIVNATSQRSELQRLFTKWKKSTDRPVVDAVDFISTRGS